MTLEQYQQLTPQAQAQVDKKIQNELKQEKENEVARARMAERAKTDPDYFPPKLATKEAMRQATIRIQELLKERTLETTANDNIFELEKIFNEETEVKVTNTSQILSFARVKLNGRMGFIDTQGNEYWD